MVLALCIPFVKMIIIILILGRTTMILFKNCRLIGELTEGYDKEFADILVNDKDKIEAIATPGELSEDNLKVVDVKGMTVLPGFFDLHCHLFLTGLDFKELCQKNIIDTCTDSYAFAREYLKQGYTTLREAGSPYNIPAGLEKAASKGIINIPQIISSGLILTPTENGNDTFSTIYREVDSPYEVRKAVREQFDKGNQVIKYMVTGAYLNESGNPGDQIALEDELREAVKIAELKNSYVMGHAHGAEGIKAGIRAGLRTIEHGSFIDEEGIQMLKDRSDSTWLVPTAAIGIACLDDDGDTLSEDAMEKAQKYEKAEKDAVNSAYNAGLKLGFGSDIDYANLVKHPGMEFYARTDWFDFKYIDILLQATKYSAEIAGLDHCKGTIKVGKNAELVVIDGKPEEDIYVMKNMPVYVYYNGELIENR